MVFDKLFNQCGVRLSMNNIAHGSAMVTAYSTPVDVYDAIEDAHDGKELLKNLKQLKLVGMNNMCIDRETASYVRIKGDDPLGNIRYIRALKEA